MYDSVGLFLSILCPLLQSNKAQTQELWEGNASQKGLNLTSPAGDFQTLSPISDCLRTDARCFQHKTDVPDSVIVMGRSRDNLKRK